MDDFPFPLIRTPETNGHADSALIAVVQRLSFTRTLADVMAIVRRAARELTGAEGATFVLREGELVHYADEDAIAPMWKGKRFPMDCCISGWAIRHSAVAVIPDIYSDPRIPIDAYRPTFVRSLVMVPIRSTDPIGAIGTYWASPHEATSKEVELLEALAHSTVLALAHVQLYEEMVNARVEAESRAADYKEAMQKLEGVQYALSDKVRELEEFFEVAVGRELKMIEMEKEIAKLKDRMAKPSFDP